MINFIYCKFGLNKVIISFIARLFFSFLFSFFFAIFFFLVDPLCLELEILQRLLYMYVGKDGGM